MVTGGVEPTVENLSSWFKAGAFAVGMGSCLFPKEVVASADWATVTRLCAEAIAVAQSLKK